jgi:hypothetical protein
VRDHSVKLWREIFKDKVSRFCVTPGRMRGARATHRAVHGADRAAFDTPVALNRRGF